MSGSGRLVGAVLCGGASTRMGRDKALVPIDGQAMAVRVAGALRAAGCDPVVAIGGDAVALGALGLAVVPDGWPGEGPLGGVVTALSSHPGADAVAVVACDTPWMTPDSIELLVDALAGTPAADAAIAVTDRIEPLCVVWRRSALPAMRAAFLAGERRVHAALASLHVVDVVVHAGDLRNVNSPDDLPD